MKPSLDSLLKPIEAGGESQPVYLVQGDLVAAEPQAVRLAEALAAKAGCEVERYRRPASLGPILTDLKTYSLFASAKVVLVLDAALLADEKAAAELIDQAAEALPLPEGELGPSGREAASRLLQALHVFGVDPAKPSAEEVLDALPKWALQGGPGLRKTKPRGRPAKEVKALKAGLPDLLAAALEAGMVGFAEGDLAELGEIVQKGLPEGHALVLAEHSASQEHPVVKELVRRKAAVFLGGVTASKKGGLQGLDPLVSALAEECGVAIARDAVAELARRTLRQERGGSWDNKAIEAGSTSRFAGEYRKLAGLAKGAGGKAQITRQLVESSVEDRGEQDLFQILDAVGAGRGGEAVAQLRRYLAAADDVVAARLGFFAQLARFCRQLVAISGQARLCEVPRGERNYFRFKERWAPLLQGDLPQGLPSPLAGVHPFQLHRAYLAASSMPGDAMAQVPAWVLETERRLKGDVTEADAALVALIGRIVALVGGR